MIQGLKMGLARNILLDATAASIHPGNRQVP